VGKKIAMPFGYKQVGCLFIANPLIMSLWEVNHIFREWKWIIKGILTGY